MIEYWVVDINKEPPVVLSTHEDFDAAHDAKRSARITTAYDVYVHEVNDEPERPE